MTAPLLELSGVGRRYGDAPAEQDALRAIDLTIHCGEMVAIVGASGSGKSTLMNILGCLDRPSTGSYRFAGRDVATLDADGLARLRCEYFGFVFQRYHLLARMGALENVALPAVYAGLAPRARRERAQRLFERVGLAGLERRRPNELSGGQQQRVSIARALMNGGRIILADEPTGALDSHSGREVMALLAQLHRSGHTVVLVTHDPLLAAQAPRVVEMRDGRIVADSGSLAPARAAVCGELSGLPARAGGRREALAGALKALSAHRLRSVLAMLGISIGIAAVVSIVALGTGARQHVLDGIRAIGTQTVYVNRGHDVGDDKADSVRTLLPRDLSALAAQEWVASVTPLTSRVLRLRYRNQDFNGQVQGVAADDFRAFGVERVSGRGLSRDDVARMAQVVVIDENVRRKLFGDEETALGKVMLVGTMPATVVGVARSRDEFRSDLQVWLPYSTAAARLFGQSYFDSLIVCVDDAVAVARAQPRLEQLMMQLHGQKDFHTFNLDRIVKQMENTTRTLTLLLSLVAVIALVVGDIGVMNIMLVSVSERTREIGVRMAVGARQVDVRRQFLIEAVLVCLLGGAIGVGLAFGAGAVFALFVTSWRMIFSWQVLALAFLCASVIGVSFGYLPARKAARLDPVEALARE